MDLAKIPITEDELAAQMPLAYNDKRYLSLIYDGECLNLLVILNSMYNDMSILVRQVNGTMQTLDRLLKTQQDTLDSVNNLLDSNEEGNKATRELIHMLDDGGIINE